MSGQEAINQRAKELAINLFQMYPRDIKEQADDPVLFLIEAALTNQNGEPEAPAQFGLRPKELDKWFGGTHSKGVRELVDMIMKREDKPIPSSKAEIVDWAAEIVLMGLDELNLLEP